MPKSGEEVQAGEAPCLGLILKIPEAWYIKLRVMKRVTVWEWVFFCSFLFWIRDYIERSKRFICGKEVGIWSPVLEILSLRCRGQPKWVCSLCAIWCVGLDLQRKSRSKPSSTYVAVDGTLFLWAVAGWWGPAVRSVEGSLEPVWLSWSWRE